MIEKNRTPQRGSLISVMRERTMGTEIPSLLGTSRVLEACHRLLPAQRVSIVSD